MHMLRSIKKYVPAAVWMSGRAAWMQVRYLLSLCTPAVQSRRYNGLQLFYGRGNTIIERLAAEPVFEKEMSMRIVADLKQGTSPVFMDIGANIGLIIANVLHELPATSVIAFEPGPKQIALLQKTIKENKLDLQVQLVPVALSDVQGTQTFYTHLGRDIAKDGLQDTGRGEKTIPITVTTSTLDVWWESQGKPHVGVVKMDTEGAELLILRGAQKFLTEVHPVLYLEIEATNLRAYPYTAYDIFDFLTGMGYRIETLRGAQVTRATLESCMVEEDTFRTKYS